MARHVLERQHYRQWNCFSWADYQEREMMARTFEVRHWPLTNGRVPHEFDEYLEDPKGWNEEQEVKKKKKFVPKRNVGVRNDEPQCDVVMVWDQDKQELVPLI